MPAPSRFSPQDWEATIVACHYHPEHVKELMKLRDDMHDYEMHVHRLATDPNHKVPDPPNVTTRMGQILGDSVAQFSRDESPLDLACRLSGIDAADVVASLPSEFSREWNEANVSRESSSHDGKHPGEFAPKNSRTDAFISTVREMGYKNPFSNETVVENAAVELHASPDGSVWLKSIRALTPRKGDGSAMLKQLTKLADEHGVEIKGEAVPFGKSMSASKLKKWYVSHGFTMNGEEFTYTPTPRLKIGSGAMRSIPIE